MVLPCVCRSWHSLQTCVCVWVAVCESMWCHDERLVKEYRELEKQLLIFCDQWRSHFNSVDMNQRVEYPSQRSLNSCCPGTHRTICCRYTTKLIDNDKDRLLRWSPVAELLVRDSYECCVMLSQTWSGFSELLVRSGREGYKRTWRQSIGQWEQWIGQWGQSIWQW